MIDKFVKVWFEKSDELREKFSAKHPDDYTDIVRGVVEIISKSGDDWDSPDPKRIRMIDDGEYQGTLVYVIGAGGYQPDKYWCVKISYGSCSGCDTLQRIRAMSDLEYPTVEQVNDYMTLALHIVQRLKEI